MGNAVRAPRINANDDAIRLTAILVAVGDRVSAGDLLFEAETEKTVVQVPASAPGVVLEILASVGSTIRVGDVVLWVGDDGKDVMPDALRPPSARKQDPPRHRATAKARLLAGRYGLSIDEVPFEGERPTAADVERALEARERSRGEDPARPRAPGRWEPLAGGDRGVVRTLRWHREEAVTAYAETIFEADLWNEYARDYAEERRSLMPPLLPLMAYQLVRTVSDNRRLNSTVVGDRRYVYDHVNLGFTVQAGDTLQLAVLSRADDFRLDDFVDRLESLQRKAMSRSLGTTESSGATVSLTSMARWHTTRHVPILPPHCATIVAHSHPLPDGTGVLGVTYDHRSVSGADAALLIRSLARPRRQDGEPA